MMLFKEIFVKRCLPIGILLILLNCGTSGKTTISKSQETTLDRLIAAKNFVITCDRALPLMTISMNSLFNSGLFPPGSAANSVNLVGNSNYLKVMGDSVAAELPYFGERQMGGGYNQNGSGVEFSGMPREWQLTKNEKAGRYELRFKINQESESFNVNVVVFPNLNSSINITSSQRFSIRYEGTAKAIEEDEL